MKNLSQSDFRDLLDDLELLHRKVDERVLVVPFPPDEDFDHEIRIVFLVDKKKLQAASSVAGYGSDLPRAKKLDFCNRWNRENITPKAYLDGDGDFVAELILLHDEDVSAECIKNNFIKLGIATIARFFKELKAYVDDERAA
ncbi:MAG: YbjN domain-containing protein [Thermoguttaceae bacterium]|jgi:hypothetical protein|nr:YbjN domain-containing protein [Thermoguttaceae bacterium]